MKKLISLYTAAVQSKRMVYHIFAISFFLLLLSSCAKDVPDQDNSATADQVIKTFPKSDLPDNYINGETVPEILVEIDKAIKPAELEHRSSDKLPFKVLGYDKTRALRIYNDSFEITSYSFLAFTDLKDLNKVVNIVVTQKKNGKPGKPYLYEYTYKPVQNRPQPLLTKIVKYKFNGVKIDLPGGNFDPCIDVVCDQYTLPAGSGGSGTGSSGGGGGGYESGGTYGSTSGGDLIYTGGGGAGTVICTKTSVTFIAVDGGTVVIDEYTCPGGYSITMVRFRSSQYLSGCCDAVSVDIGVVTITESIQNFIGIESAVLYSPSLVTVEKMRETVTLLRNLNFDSEWCDLMTDLLSNESVSNWNMGDHQYVYRMIEVAVGQYNEQVKAKRDALLVEAMTAFFGPNSPLIEVLGMVNLPGPPAPKYVISEYLRERLAKGIAEVIKNRLHVKFGKMTFNELKAVLPDPGNGKVYHHLVEQNQIINSGFDPRMVHHPNNVIPIKKEFNTFLNGRYQVVGLFPETDGLSLREFLKGKPIEFQIRWGIKVYNEYKHLYP